MYFDRLAYQDYVRQKPNLALAVGYNSDTLPHVTKSFNILSYDVLSADTRDEICDALNEFPIGLVVVSEWQQPELRNWLKKICAVNDIRYLNAKTLFC